MSAADNRALGEDELQAVLEGLQGWTVRDGRLACSFVFTDFPAAMAFMMQSAFAAEALEHHPNWSNVYNRVDVELWSHDLGGVSELCAKLAARMSAIASVP